jgi:putative transposase
VADVPNKEWVTNFSYIWTAEGWLYLAAVPDRYNPRVVGWSMQSSLASQLVIDSLMTVICRRGKPGSLLHHSDQGSQYTSGQFQRLLVKEGITFSMNGAVEA